MPDTASTGPKGENVEPDKQAPGDEAPAQQEDKVSEEDIEQEEGDEASAQEEAIAEQVASDEAAAREAIANVFNELNVTTIIYVDDLFELQDDEDRKVIPKQL